MLATEEKINEFLLNCKYAKNLTDKTLKSYKSDLLLFNNYIKNNDDIKDAILDYVKYLLDTQHKITTIKRYLSTIYQFINFVYRKDSQNNPIRDLDIKFKCEKILPKTISTHEMKKLFQCLYNKSQIYVTTFQKFQHTRDIALLDLISSTGIRIGEAASLQYNDIDLKTRLVLIHGKGRKERIIYLSCPETINNLKNWLQLRHKIKNDNNYVFINRYNKPLSVHGIEDIFRKYRDAANINPIATPHFLRHTFATNLLSNGSDIRSVQEILGHSSISITERYTEVTQNQKIKMLKKYNYRNNLLN